MQRVHADGVPRRLDRLSAPARRLQHAQLRLELGRVATECLERLSNAVRVVALAALRQVFEARQRRQRWLLSWFLCGHLRLAPPAKYAGSIGRRFAGALTLRCSKRDTELVESLFRRRRRSPCQGIRPARRLREGDHLANVRLPREEREEPLVSEREATVRRRAHLQGLEEPAELRARLLV